MRFTSLRVSGFELDYMVVTWEVDLENDDALAVTYDVERAESPAGPFDKIVEGFKDRYVLRDYIAPAQRRVWASIYYRVTAHTPSGDVVSEAKTCDPRPPLDGMEISRLHNKLLKEYVGRPVATLGIRTFGDRCSSCYDRVTGRRTASKCAVCWNTGFQRGYHKPIMAYMQIDPEMRQQTNTSELVSEQAMTSARLSVYPLLKPRDLIIEGEGRRWRVANVRRTERLRAPIHQEVSLTLITPGDIEYKIPINFPEYDDKTRSYTYKDDL
jgi:hypothetical protein